MKQQRTTIRIILSIVFILSAISIVVLPLKIQIASPRLTSPAILLPGSELTITVQHSFPLVFSDWRVQLIATSATTGKLSAIDLNMIKSSPGFATTTLSVRLPATIHNGRYSLAISQPAEKIPHVRENAVHVRQKFSEDLSIIQLADLPVLGGDGKGDIMLDEIITEINLINPDVVLFSGDLAYGGSWDQYQRLIKLLKKLYSPVVAVPGNHAYYGWAGYLSLLGQPYHQVTIGDYQLISLNSGHGRDQLTQSQLAWFSNTVSDSKAKSRIVQLHHPIQHRPELGGYLRANRQAVLQVIKDSNVAIVLSGHWHGDSVYDITGAERTSAGAFAGPPFVVTTTAGADFRQQYSSSPLHYGYRLIRLNNGSLENFTYDYDGDGVRDAASSIPYGKLKVSPRGRYGVVVSNGLNETLSNARVRLRIPDATSTYSPSRGKIDTLEKLAGESIYTLLVDLPANHDTTISMIQDGYKD